MKKNIKAIIAAVSASIMCAVPVAASFASTAATGITAEAYYTDWATSPAICYVAQAAPGLPSNYVTANALVYQLNNSNNTAMLTGKSSTDAEDIVLPDIIKYNGKLYKITSVKADSFYGSTAVLSFKGGKYLELIDSRAFANSSCTSVEVNSRAITVREEAFSRANLRSVKLPAKATVKTRAFRDNAGLQTVDFICNDSTNYNTAVNLDRTAFRNCTSLTRVNAENRRMLNLYRSTFNNCPCVGFYGFSLNYYD